MSTIAQQAYDRYFSGNEWFPQSSFSVDNDYESNLEDDNLCQKLLGKVSLKELSGYVAPDFNVVSGPPAAVLGESATVFFDFATLHESGFYALASKKWARRAALGEALAEKDSFAARFSKLAKKWKEDTLYSSSGDEILNHPAYKEILGMGKDALPYILRDLEVEGGHWFHALHAITGVNPYPSEDAGRVKKMREAWLRWARENMLLS